MNIEPIAYIHTDFDEKFGIPRQSGRVRSLTGRIVFAPEYRKPEALRGIDGFSHLWLLFDFSLADEHCSRVGSESMAAWRETGVYPVFHRRELLIHGACAL